MATAGARPDRRGIDNQAAILIVDDIPEKLKLLSSILSGLDIAVVTANSGADALRLLLNRSFAAILMDVQMPGMDGFETAALIRSRKKSAVTPIIFVTAWSHSDEQVRRGYSLGAVDYIFVPVVPEILKAKISVFVELHHKTRQLEAEVERRRRVEEEITTLNRELERKVDERSRELLARSEELRAMTQQLWHAAKLATMGELSASIAHELNNPLATVSLRVESLLSTTPEDDPRRSALAIIEQEVDRMGNLVANLLRFGRKTQRQISTLHIAEEIDNTVELIFYHLRKHGIAVARDFVEAPPVLADRQLLRQLFLNLFTNAVDAMEGGGTLTLRKSVRGGLGNNHGKTFVVVEVIDTGMGIPADIMPRIMEPFFTTKREGKGTGLGLAICRRIVEEHNGVFEIESEPGRGTTARVALPVDGTSDDGLTA